MIMTWKSSLLPSFNVPLETLQYVPFDGLYSLAALHSQELLTLGHCQDMDGVAELRRKDAN
jgi:hypothetical protein